VILGLAEIGLLITVGLIVLGMVVDTYVRRFEHQRDGVGDREPAADPADRGRGNR
jgi:hypothetical protein